MKVLCVNERTDYITHGLLATLRKMGSTVKLFPLSRIPWERQYTVLSDLIKDFKPTLIFTPGWSLNIFNLEALVRAIKKTRTFHAYWATEDPTFFNEVSMTFAPYSDYIFTTAQEMQERYDQLHKPNSTLLFGVNPDFFRPVNPNPKYKYDIILVANNYPWFPADRRFRDEAIRTVLLPLIDKGYNLKVFGVDWTNPQNTISIPPEYYGGYCPYEETPAAYCSAKIVLGLQSVNTSVTQTSCRTFEIMGCGAFYLTIQTPSHAALFENHRHLVWTSNPAETLALVDYYLAHDTERIRIARAGRSEVLKHHTYQHRVLEFRQKIRPFLGRHYLTRKSR